MNRHITGMLLALLTALLMTAGVAGADENAEEMPEWTVLCYFCGSDLESKYGFASGNLKEIADCVYSPRMIDISREFDGDPEKQEERYRFVEAGYTYEKDSKQKNVNVLIQTGGSREWHTGDQSLDMDIDPGKLQRWRVEQGINENYSRINRIILEESLPLQSMADPVTLADFIRWGTQVCPAKKYALVLWGHGGGAKTGLFVDELFDGDVMGLDELSNAFKTAGTRFETVLFDACLMANLETAWVCKDYANWMVASEELVAGKGTAISDWLLQLYNDPIYDGKRLGDWICDFTFKKYANENDMKAQLLTTWSVIDLSKIERLGALFDRFFEDMGKAYTRYPRMMSVYQNGIIRAEHFDTEKTNMVDLSDILYNNLLYSYMDTDLRRELLDVLSDALVHSVKGIGRSAARGLSFCYTPSFSCEELDTYARNCPFPHYLALIDAVHVWKAPEWVYEIVEPLPEIDSLSKYSLDVEKQVFTNGIPGVILTNDYSNTTTILYRMYRLNPETSQVQRLGSFSAVSGSDDNDNVIWYADEPWLWPSIDGVYCCMETVETDTDDRGLCNIPIQMDSGVWNLRCGYDGSLYTVYGMWEGYDSDSVLFNRNVKVLSQAAGQDFKLLYPVRSMDSGGLVEYEESEPMTMLRSLEVQDKPLPEGIYYLEYVVVDMFEREHPLELISLNWDGDRMEVTGETDWSGTERLSWYKGQ